MAIGAVLIMLIKMLAVLSVCFARRGVIRRGGGQ